MRPIVWQYYWRGDAGCTPSVDPRSGDPPPSGDAGCRGRDVSGPGSPCVWRVPAVGARVGSPQGRRRAWGTSLAPARASARAGTATVPGGHGGPPDHGSLSRPTQDALYALDTRGGLRPAGPEVRPAPLRLDRRSRPPALGLHAAKTRPAGLRTGSRGGAPLAHAAVSGHPRAGPSGAGDDLLGRRDREALGPSGRAVVRASRAHAGDPGHGGAPPAPP